MQLACNRAGQDHLDQKEDRKREQMQCEQIRFNYLLIYSANTYRVASIVLSIIQNFEDTEMGKPDQNLETYTVVEEDRQ